MKVADMVPDNPGIWLFHCHVEDHMMAGMSALYEVVK
jgi:FtsP/CotA-like multicopper oxidase with cupredoxin domain